MIFNEVLATYLGWCPKFNIPLAEPKQTQIPNLSSVGKAVIIIFLLLFGLDNVKYFNSDLSNLSYFINLIHYYNFLEIPRLIIPILQILSLLIFGVTLLIIVADFSISKKILMRHRLELAILFSSQAIFNITIVIAHFPKDDWIYHLFSSSIFVILLLHLTNQVLKNRRMLNRTTFMILSIFFIEEMARELIFYPLSLLYSDQFWMRIALIVEWEIICGVAAYFCLKVYRDLKENTSFVLSVPWYVKLIAIMYGLAGLNVDVYLFTWNYYFPSNNFFGYLLYRVKYVGLIIVSFLPLKFSVGEVSTVIDSTAEKQNYFSWRNLTLLYTGIIVVIIILNAVVIPPLNVFWLSHLPYTEKNSGSITINRSETIFTNSYVNSSTYRFYYNFKVVWANTGKFIIKDKLTPGNNYEFNNDPGGIARQFNNETGDLIVSLSNPYITNPSFGGGFRITAPQLFVEGLEPTYTCGKLNCINDNEYDFNITVSPFELVNKTDISSLRLVLDIIDKGQYQVNIIENYPKKDSNYWDLNSSLPIQNMHSVCYHVKDTQSGRILPELMCKLYVTYSKQIHFNDYPTVEGGNLTKVINQGITYTYDISQKNIQIQIVQGDDRQYIYDDELTESYNYTNLLTKDKQVLFKYNYKQAIRADYIGETIAKSYTLQNTSRVIDWLHSLEMPNIVKGVSKAAIEYLTNEENLIVDTPGVLTRSVELILGDPQGYHFHIEGASLKNTVAFSITFSQYTKGYSDNPWWGVKVSKMFYNPFYTTQIIFYHKNIEFYFPTLGD